VPSLLLGRAMTELIPTVKMETRHPVDGSFASEFSSIYNHCGVMAALSGSPMRWDTPLSEYD